jgi:hypothetical protein
VVWEPFANGIGIVHPPFTAVTDYPAGATPGITEPPIYRLADNGPEWVEDLFDPSPSLSDAFAEFVREPARVVRGRPMVAQDHELEQSDQVDRRQFGTPLAQFRRMGFRCALTPYEAFVALLAPRQDR